MKRILFLLFSIAALCEPLAVRAEPRPDLNSVTLPTFIFDQRHAITAGVAFLVEEQGQAYLATAYHVLGPAGGLKSKIAPRDVPREVRAMVGLCLGDTRTLLLGSPMLLVSDARSFDEDGGEADVAFAAVKDRGGATPLKLGNALPKVGDRVWVLVRLVDRDRPTLYPATVSEAKPTLVQYAMEDADLNMRAASGAPVLSGDGAVVAMHLGHGKTEDRLVGIAAPAPAIRERLVGAVKDEKK
jgi:hypothetical protein